MPSSIFPCCLEVIWHAVKCVNILCNYSVIDNRAWCLCDKYSYGLMQFNEFSIAGDCTVIIVFSLPKVIRLYYELLNFEIVNVLPICCSCKMYIICS